MMLANIQGLWIQTIVWVVCLVLAGCNVSSSEDEAIDQSMRDKVLLQMEVGSAELLAGQVVLNSTLINNTQEAISFLPWNTPLESNITGRFLDIKDSQGRVVPYQGIMLKRRAPIVDDYIQIGPSTQLKGRLNLTKSYSFCAENKYTIEFTRRLYQEDGRTIELQSEPTNFVTNLTFPQCTR